MPAETPIDPSQQYLAFVRQQALQLRGNDAPPKNKAEWEQRRQKLRDNLYQAWGGFPMEKCDLEPKIVGEIKKDGYRIEKLYFQTRPGVFMTANAYVPEGNGKRPAVLAVHGHWKLAKQDHKVQARCHGLAKLGFFVLCVDAMGAGERGVGKPLGEYHGDMTGATTWPVGLPLSGLQVYENMRAVDYLQSRPEVDGKRLGITGASGGGNQSMYSGGWDDRFSCVVPVCSVGRYQSYLGAACCVCEVVPNVLTFTEEWGVLGLAAPRALMVINATRDAFQFSIGEARKSLEVVRRIYELYGKPQNLKHATFESIHDYSQAMREIMYGWMTLHLKGEGKGDPIPEPAYTLDDPETLRCFPNNSRPDSYLTIPKYAATEGRKLVERHNAEAFPHAGQWQAVATRKEHLLAETVLGGFPKRAKPNVSVLVDLPRDKTYEIETEPGIRIGVRWQVGSSAKARTAIVLDLTPSGHPRDPRGRSKAESSDLAKGLVAAGWNVVTADLRTIGHYVSQGDSIGRAPDHNSSEWGLLIGRPVIGQWVWDLQRLMDVLADKAPQAIGDVTIIGVGPAGLVALCAAALDKRIHRAATIGSLATFVTDLPYEGQRMGTLAPGMLRHVGDVPHLAALIAPRPVQIINPVNPDGSAATAADAGKGFEATRKVYEVLSAADKFAVATGEKDEGVLKRVQGS